VKIVLRGDILTPDSDRMVTGSGLLKSADPAPAGRSNEGPHVEGGEMNKGHMEFCTSADWQEILEKLILPGAIDRVDLGPRVVEIGPGPGFPPKF
jgi:hypothetical protein